MKQFDFPFLHPIITHREMEQIDQLSCVQYGAEASDLMENAAGSIWNQFLTQTDTGVFFSKKLSESDLFLFLCGSGNNGGDGLVIACKAFEMGYKNISIFISKDKGSPLFIKQLKRLRTLGLNPEIIGQDSSQIEKLKRSILSSDWLFDAFLGTGGYSPLRKEWNEIASLWNQQRGKRVAVDLPSGISEEIILDNKAVEDNSLFFNTDLTLTVNFHKKSFYNVSNRIGCGKICVCDAGFPQLAIDQILNFKDKINSYWRIDFNSLWDFFKSPNGTTATKNSRGRILIAAGSKEYPGATSLVSESASYGGGGYIKVASHPDALSLVLTRIPSVVPLPRINGWEYATEGLSIDSINRNSVIVAGSGWNESIDDENLLNRFLDSDVPLILDAGALNLISSSLSLAHKVKKRKDVLLTPQKAEFKRLLKPLKCFDLDVLTLKDKQALQHLEEIDDNILLKVAKYYHSPILLKESISRIALPSGEIIFYDSCRAHLAQAGSGDTLAGLIAALYHFTFNIKSPECRLAISAIAACVVQGEASDKAFEQCGWIPASDLPPFYGSVLSSKIASTSFSGLNLDKRLK